MNKEQRSAWRKANPEKHAAEQRLNYHRNAAKIAKRHAEYRLRYPEKHAARKAVDGATRRARKTQAGGSFTPEQWLKICRAAEFRCLCCHRRRKLTADHVVPVSKGGDSNIENIQPLCMPCNHKKYNRTIDYRV